MEKVKYNLNRLKITFLISYIFIIPLVFFFAAGRFSFLIWAICLPLGIGHFLYFVRVQMPKCKDIYFFYDGITIINQNQSVFIAWEHLSFEPKLAILPIFKPILLTSICKPGVKEYNSIDWLCSESFLELSMKYCPESSEFRKYIFNKLKASDSRN